MRKCLLLFSLMPFFCIAQSDSSKLLRAFPITSYMLDLTDTTKLVQIQLQDGHALPEKQLGMMYGVYDSSAAAAVQKGYGRCQLIKGDYYYFSISGNKSGLILKEGDLLYTMMDKTNVYHAQAAMIAAHHIRLTAVDETPLYDMDDLFYQWSETDEKRFIDSIRKDIQFTGQYFIQNAPEMDRVIAGGGYAGMKTLYVMAECQNKDVKDFLDYIIARPRNYAGGIWKVAEIFATWLAEGAPTVIKK